MSWGKSLKQTVVNWNSPGHSGRTNFSCLGWCRNPSLRNVLNYLWTGADAGFLNHQQFPGNSAGDLFGMDKWPFQRFPGFQQNFKQSRYILEVVVATIYKNHGSFKMMINPYYRKLVNQQTSNHSRRQMYHSNESYANQTYILTPWDVCWVLGILYTVAGRNPKQPLGMHKTWWIMGFQLPTSTG